MMSPDQAVEEMLERNDDFALKCAREIAKAEGWVSQHEPVKALKHIRRMLRADDSRGFKLRWASVVMNTSVYFDDVPNLLIPSIEDPMRDREYELRQKRREMMRVEPESSARRMKAG